jgi:NRPS condensation-like uncharacterized protein
MANSERRRTFFNSVDESLHLLDEAEPTQPLSIQFELRAPGALDEQRLREAVAAACAVHPMARARQVPWKASQPRYEWEITQGLDLDPVRVVDAGDDEATGAARAALQSRCVSLAESPPFRVCLVRHPGGDYVMLNVNHSASDGVGTLRLMRSIVRAYAGDPDPTPEVDPLAVRDLDVELAPATLEDRLRGWRGMIDSWSKAASAPARLAPDGGNDQAGFGFHHVTLPADRTAALDPKRYAPGTVNDLLLAALARTVETWNADHGAPCQRVGLMMPVNVRPRDRWYDVVGNFAGDVTISTTTKERADRAALITAIANQTRQAKDDGTASAVLALLASRSAVPIGVKQAMTALLAPSADRYANSAVLSNVGRVAEPMSFGADGEASELWFSPPARTPMSLGLGAASYGGRLHLAFRYCHASLSAAAAERFAGRYLEALAELG